MAAWDSFRRLFHPRRIVWQNWSGFYCVGLDQLCPMAVVSCIDDGREYDLIEQSSGLRFCCLERGAGRRAKFSGPALEEVLPGVRRQIEDILRENGGGRWVLVCPLPCRTFSAFAAETSAESACPDAELGCWLDDKANFFSGLDQLGLPRMPGRWIRLSEARYAELASELGGRFVAQLAVGAGGTGTAFIQSEADMATAGARLGDDLVWVAPHRGELSLNVNAVAMAASVVVGYPSVQLVGLKMLHCEPGVYCGNDYAAAAGLPVSTLDEVRQQTERIGGWIASLGYRGLFGLDFVPDPSSSQVYAVDLNARWQGSTALLTQAECRAGRLPLAAADLACQLGVLGEAEIRRRGDAFFEPVQGSQMSLRWNLADWPEITGELGPGVYSSGPEPAYLRPGVSLEDLRAPGEMLVTGAVPRTGDLMLKGAPVLRAYSLEPVMDLNRMAPLPWSQNVARELYRRLALEPVE